MTPAGKLYALVNKLKAERDGLTEARAKADAALIERAQTFDEGVARRDLARATAQDAINGTNAADALAQAQEAERARLAKEAAAVQKRREKAMAELAGLDRRETDLDAQISEAEHLLASEVAHEREPQPFVVMVPTFLRSDVEIPGGVDLGRGLIEVAEDVTGPMVRGYHKTMIEGLFGISVSDRAAA